MNAKQKEQTIEEIKKLLEENNGIVKAEKLYPLGLTYKSIQGLVKAGILDHVKSGYYSIQCESGRSRNRFDWNRRERVHIKKCAFNNKR